MAAHVAPLCRVPMDCRLCAPRYLGLVLFASMMLACCADTDSTPSRSVAEDSSLLITELLVEVSATGSVAMMRSVVTLRNTGASPAASVLFALPPGSSGSVAAVGKRLARDVALLPLVSSSSPVPHAELFGARLPDPLLPGAEISLVVGAILPLALEPSPAEITEGEAQYVRLNADALFASPYRVVRARGTLKLASPPVAGSVAARAPFEISDFSVELGPYEGLRPFDDGRVSVRFKHDQGFLVAREAVREMRISHWGNVAVREEFRVENMAAKHVGRWSRVDYADKTSRRGRTAISDVWAYLPRKATNVMYRDLVGNITTSRLRRPNNKHRPLNAEFRFPLLGGWKNHFWYTYDVPLGIFATSRSSSHRIKVPIYPSINGGFLCDKLIIRVLLPEGATNVNVVPHETLKFDRTETVERTSLNYVGRHVVTLIAEQVYTSAAVHKGIIIISYDFSAANLLVTPLIVTAGIFGFFLVVIAYTASDMTLVAEADDPIRRADNLASDLQLRVVGAVRSIAKSHAQLDYLFTSLKSASDIGSIAERRMNIETSLKEQETVIANCATELKSLGVGKAEIAAALVQRFALKRDACMRAFASRITFLEGRMGEETYRSQLNHKLSATLSVVSDELGSLVEALTEDM